MLKNRLLSTHKGAYPQGYAQIIHQNLLPVNITRSIQPEEIELSSGFILHNQATYGKNVKGGVNYGAMCKLQKERRACKKMVLGLVSHSNSYLPHLLSLLCT